MDTKIKIEEFDKENLHFITLTNQSNLKVTLCNLGASIYSIYYDDKLMTLTPSKISDFSKICFYHGKTIGRTCNRIKGNTITINNEKYTIENNEGPNTLHGGIHGISGCKFNMQTNPNSDSSINIIYTYTSPEFESGYPGNLSIKVTYTIPLKSTELKIQIEADTDKDTLCSLTNHAYYTIGEKDLSNVSLKINAGHYLHTCPDDLIGIEKRELTPYLDFREIKPIFKDINESEMINSKAKGYDHHYYFDKVDCCNAQAVLKGSQYQMEIITDYSGMQIYSDNNEGGEFIDVVGNCRRGIAIEPQESQLDNRILKKGEHYNHMIKLKFYKIK